ncbi:MAG: phosphoadenylyl-sulfate reductase [Pseudomonadota bacterium]
MTAVTLYARASADFDAKLAETIALLKKADATLQPLTQASSLGAEDMVITHLLDLAEVNSSIFVLDTGMLHEQTLALVPRIEERYQRKVDIYGPDTDVASDFVQNFGEQAMYKSLALRKQCCGFRKLEPLKRALTGKKGWLTGLRREQSDARAEVEFIELEGERAKVNPLARWTAGDVWHFIGLHAIPYNPLHDEFFPSIGCAPCTRAVTLGEDIRSGRWWWEQASAKECGLHVAGEAAASSIIPIKEVSA